MTSSGTSVQIKANSDKTKTEILPAHRKSRSDNMNQSRWKLPDFFFFFPRSESETDRGTEVDGGRMRGKREEGRRKASHRDEQMDWQGEREVEMDRGKRSSFPCSLRISGSKGIGKKKNLQVFHQALGVTGPRSSCQWVFFLGFCKSATCPNLEDAVYSWGRDKPAAPAPPPSEQSGHYQRTKKERCTATSIWFWLEHIQRLCKFY